MYCQRAEITDNAPRGTPHRALAGDLDSTRRLFEHYEAIGDTRMQHKCVPFMVMQGDMDMIWEMVAERGRSHTAVQGRPLLPGLQALRCRHPLIQVCQLLLVRNRGVRRPVHRNDPGQSGGQRLHGRGQGQARPVDRQGCRQAGQHSPDVQGELQAGLPHEEGGGGNPVVALSSSFAFISPDTEQYLPEYLELFFRTKDFEDPAKDLEAGMMIKSLFVRDLTRSLLVKTIDSQIGKVDEYRESQLSGTH